jgi:F0F1-type ATP synthase epsilon subunit
VSKKEEGAPTLRLEVLSLGSGGLVLEGITSLQLKLADGSWLGIRPGHAPLIAATDDGLLKYKQDGEEQTAPVKAGIMTLSNNLISILTTH